MRRKRKRRKKRAKKVRKIAVKKPKKRRSPWLLIVGRTTASPWLSAYSVPPSVVLP
jgi:hypothetical protein